MFVDRYISLAAQDQYYLEQLVHYIHVNALRAGICKDLDHLSMYPWSGHSAIMANYTNNFQEIDAVLSRFGNARQEVLIKYELFLKESIDTECDDLLLGIVRKSNKGNKDSSSLMIDWTAARSSLSAAVE